MGKKTTCVNPYVFPGLKLTQRERENFKNLNDEILGKTEKLN